MRVQHKVGPAIIVEADGVNPAEVFDSLASLEEIFRPRPCGLCKSMAITLTLRTDKEGNKYRMQTCLACGAEFRFGLKRGPGGILFPQLKDKQGKPKPDGGWVRYGSPRTHDDDDLSAPF